MKIEIKDVKKRIKGIDILDGINIELKSGHIYGIKGVNGSGKTMLMRVICGLVRTTEGEVRIDGKLIGKDITFPESVGVLIENPGLIMNYTGFQNLRTLADINKIATDTDIKELLKKLNLNPDDPKKVKKYSLGMKQKIGIAEAFLENPELLILDEPFNALDTDSVGIVSDMIKGYKNDERIIIVTCHEKELLEDVCDKILIMEEGKIVDIKEKNNI